MPDSLFAQAVSIAAVTAAWERVRGNGGTPGGDGMSLADFATAAPPRLAALNWALTHKRYTPGPVRRLSVPKSSGTGRRTLTIPCVTDRIAQTAVAVALTAVLEPEFEPSSYAYRQGRSVQQAVARVAHLHANGYP